MADPPPSPSHPPPRRPPSTLSIPASASKLPDLPPDPRRKLLLVYIHGFYGNGRSFRSFPAHVHRLVGLLVADSHVVYSKIYPRYKTYNSIQLARDNFSTWLEPHQSPLTDVVLVGHSMGGLLAAEVVLMPNRRLQSSHPFKHRILGILSLDAPFLGLHPGIVSSGISSLLHPSPTASPPHHDLVDAPSSSSPPSGPPHRDDDKDPTFDPPYWNDAPYREQPLFRRLVNFAAKHMADGVLSAARNHLISHLEYGGCLADYRGLLARYHGCRALEDVDEVQAARHRPPPDARARVRFVNYYTVCAGRPKSSSPPDVSDTPPLPTARRASSSEPGPAFSTPTPSPEHLTPSPSHTALKAVTSEKPVSSPELHTPETYLNGHQQDAEALQTESSHRPANHHLGPVQDRHLVPAQDTAGPGDEPEGTRGGKKKKGRRFCILPSKRDGLRDGAWVEVDMGAVDEVAAHCGLFDQGPHYDGLVGDVGGRIADWLQGDLSTQAILALES